MKIEPGPYRVASEKASSSETARATKSQHKSACAGPTPARFDSQEIDKAAKLYTVVQRDPLCIREVLRLRPRTPMGSMLSYRRACAQEHREWPCAIQSIDVGGPAARRAGTITSFSTTIPPLFVICPTLSIALAAHPASPRMPATHRSRRILLM
jgi:hypothetical protein